MLQVKATYENEISQHKQTIQSLNANIQELQRSVQQLQNQIESLKTSNDKTAESFAQRLKNMNLDMESLRHEYEIKIEQMVAENDRKLKMFEQQKADLEAELKNQKELFELEKETMRADKLLEEAKKREKLMSVTIAKLLKTEEATEVSQVVLLVRNDTH